MSTPTPTLSASALKAIAQSRLNYIVAGGIAAVCLVPMFALWAFMVLGYMGFGYRLKKSGTGDGSKAVQNLLPLRLQFINFTASVICMALEAQRRFTPIGSDHIIDTCMGATISMVLFYCMAKWSTYSFLMVKVYIASRGLNAAELKKKRDLLLVMSVLLAVTCLAITSVSRGEMFKDTGMCLWILKGLWIAAFYPVGDLILSAYLIRAFIKPLRDTAKKSSNNELIGYVIKENIQVGVVVIASSSVIHILVGIGAMAGVLRLQLITEALICFDMLVNSIALFYSTRRSWVRAGAADSSVVDQRTQGRESIRGEAPLNRGKSGSVNADMQLSSPKSETSKTIPGTVTSDQGANFV